MAAKAQFSAKHQCGLRWKPLIKDIRMFYLHKCN